MRIGVYSDSLPHLDRRQLLTWCAARGVSDIELGVGAWGPLPRHLDVQTIGRREERDRLAAEMRDFGIRLAAVNAAGNLLHPDGQKRQDAQARFRAAVELAVALGVERVITMSGCPAGPGGGSLGVFPCWATSSDNEQLFSWQLEHELGPFWNATSRWLEAEAPGVRVCLELHPGVAIFNAAGFEALLPYVGSNIGINLDPSHFWWQGIDPLHVIERLGDRIGFCHGKDTLLYPDRIRREGLLHYPPPVDPEKATWHFAAVGDGHDTAIWTDLVRALRAVGYDDVVSIEHEDPRFDAEIGTERSLAGLRRALASQA